MSSPKRRSAEASQRTSGVDVRPLMTHEVAVADAVRGLDWQLTARLARRR